MLFSVFNDNARCWEYFEAPGTSADYGARGTKYRPLQGRPSGPTGRGLGGGGRGLGPIGYTPEALALILPVNARKVGHGTEARGVVAVQRNDRALAPSRLDGVFLSDFGFSGFDGGLGASDEPPPPPVAPVIVEGIPLSKVIFAACVASVVGVVVQKLLK